MNGEIMPPEAQEQLGSEFSERLRKALAHDLRTPLGTIANYAAILEFHDSANKDEVRAFAVRIRLAATQMATMLQQLSLATELSKEPAQLSPVDVSGHLRALLADLNLHARFPAHGTEPAKAVPFHPGLLDFAWSSFLAMQNGEHAQAGLDVDVDVEVDDRQSTLELWVGMRPTDPPRRVGLAEFNAEHFARSAHASCFALGLAEDLIRQRGGSLELWGKPSQASSIRLTLPRER
jgi:signal transduction histidine kinase